MDCADNNSAKLDDINTHPNEDGGGDIEEVNKATTSGSSSNIIKEAGEGENVVKQLMITTMIVKGKRTKRQRLGDSRYGNVNTVGQEEVEDEDEAAEELDMAKCLILLAQGQPRPLRTIRRNESGLFAKQCSSNKRSVKGLYECKTCNKAFTSFQALGGHRASHKKLKVATGGAVEFRPPKHFAISPSDSPTPLVTVAASSSSYLSLQLGNIRYGKAPPIPASAQTYNDRGKSGNRVHECSICGAEFSSGQALGGHMRRHRGTILPLNSSTTTTTTTTIANTTLSLSTTVIATDSSANAATPKANPISTGNNDGLLSLDLNLPASPSPEDDDQSKFSFTPKQPQSQQQEQQFSTPALVDCFY